MRGERLRRMGKWNRRRTKRAQVKERKRDTERERGGNKNIIIDRLIDIQTER